MGNLTLHDQSGKEVGTYQVEPTDFAPHIKRIFLVRPGYAHIHLDKKQAEMYALGHYSKDQKLLELLAAPESVHDGMCKVMSKSLSLLVFYLMQPNCSEPSLLKCCLAARIGQNCDADHKPPAEV